MTILESKTDLHKKFMTQFKLQNLTLFHTYFWFDKWLSLVGRKLKDVKRPVNPVWYCKHPGSGLKKNHCMNFHPIRIYPDPTTNSENTNQTFPWFVYLDSKESDWLIKLWKFRIFSFRIGCWIWWAWYKVRECLLH